MGLYLNPGLLEYNIKAAEILKSQETDLSLGFFFRLQSFCQRCVITDVSDKFCIFFFRSKHSIFAISFQYESQKTTSSQWRFFLFSLIFPFLFFPCFYPTSFTSSAYCTAHVDWIALLSADLNSSVSVRGRQNLYHSRVLHGAIIKGYVLSTIPN
jgi:hypothetical protein